MENNEPKQEIAVTEDLKHILGVLKPQDAEIYCNMGITL